MRLEPKAGVRAPRTLFVSCCLLLGIKHWLLPPITSDLFLSRFRNVESFILSFMMVLVPLLLVCPNYSVVAFSAPKMGKEEESLRLLEFFLNISKRQTHFLRDCSQRLCRPAPPLSSRSSIYPPTGPSPASWPESGQQLSLGLIDFYSQYTGLKVRVPGLLSGRWDSNCSWSWKIKLRIE